MKLRTKILGGPTKRCSRSSSRSGMPVGGGHLGFGSGVSSLGRDVGILGRLEFFVVFIGITQLVANMAAMTCSLGKGD